KILSSDRDRNCKLSDWRERRLIGMDGIGVKKPEDIHSAVYNSDGTMTLSTVFPSEISDQRYFQTGLECFAVGIEKILLADGTSIDLRVKLAAVKQHDWISCSRGNEYLDVLRSGRGRVRKEELPVFHDLSRIN